MEKINILMVDDDANLLESYKRKLSMFYNVDTMIDAQKAIESLTVNNLNVDIIISDQRMPGIKGVDFLIQAKSIQPDAMRIMLSGEANLDEAIYAINKGNIFRFLKKPCALEAIKETIESAYAYKQLKNVEKDLLENTLKKSINMLSELLEMTSPIAYGRAKRATELVDLLSHELNYQLKNDLSIGTSLSQIGCVTIPLEILEKSYRKEELSSEESKIFNAHPEIGYEMIQKIPRMGKVAYFVKHQNKEYQAFEINEKNLDSDLNFGCNLMKLSFHYDSLQSFSTKTPQEIAKLIASKNQQNSNFHPQAIETLKKVSEFLKSKKEVTIEANDVSVLEMGTTFENDVLTEGGQLLIAKGFTVTPSLRTRLVNLSRKTNIQYPIFTKKTLSYQKNTKDN